MWLFKLTAGTISSAPRRSAGFAPWPAVGRATSFKAPIAALALGRLRDLERRETGRRFEARSAPELASRPDDRRVVVPRGHHDRRHAVLRLGIDVGPLLDQEAGQLDRRRPLRDVPHARLRRELRRSRHERRDALGARSAVDVGTGVDERLRGIVLSVADGPGERRNAARAFQARGRRPSWPASRSSARGCD